MSEEIVGHLTVLDLWDNRSSLVFTTNRVIVARIQSALVAGLGAGTGGLLGGLGVAAADKKAKQKESEQEKLTPENILLANKKNFSIPYDGIVKIEMKKPGTFGRGKIKIFTSEKNYGYTERKERRLQ